MQSAVKIQTNLCVKNPCITTSGSRRVNCRVFASQSSEHAKEYSFLPSLTSTAMGMLLATAISFTPPALAANETQEVVPMYFGSGCFWGRQYDFINTEKNVLKRPVEQLSAFAGYAGGKLKSESNNACYYYNPDKSTIYERLGHAEVVNVEVRGQTLEQQEEEFRAYAKTYFKQFFRLPNGQMIRQDPQDEGPGYRSVVGIPGGINSPFFKILQEENVNNMQLLEGSGNEFSKDGRPTEGDKINTIWVVDSEKLPFYQGEKYHQFHNGIGKAFPTSYTKDLKEAMLQTGKLKGQSGCAEYFFLGS